MKYTIVLTLVAVIISVAFSGKLAELDFPNCARSDSFKSAFADCAKQTFGEQFANSETKPDLKNITPEQKETMEACVSQSLGFDVKGTITIEDVTDIMATMVITNEDIRTALTTDVTKCITENQGEGPKVLLCLHESIKKNCK